MNKETDDDGMGHGIGEFLEAWHGNRELSDERRRYWIDRLRNEAELRRLVAGEIHLAGLARAVQAGEPRWLRIEESLFGAMGDESHADLDFESDVMAAVGRRRMGFARPWLAAAAGLMIGLLSASMVWALTSTKAVATVSRLFTLADGSFEKGGGVIASGLPTTFGVWSGDRSEIVSEGGVAPAEGTGVLRFLEAEREPALPAYGAAACDVFQLVDLSSLKSPGANDDATLELSVRFRDSRAGKGEVLNFFGRIILFSGDPGTIVPEWPFSQEKALATASVHVASEGRSPDTWHLGRAKVLMPAEADFAVVHIMVHEPESQPGKKAVFGEQYADDVRLTLTTQPPLPVRVAEP